MPLTKGNLNAGKADETAKVVAAAEAAAPAAEGAEFGAKSNMIAFVAPLGDPSRDDVTFNTVNGQREKTVTPRIVGYRFKALEAMDIPDIGTDDDFKGNPMSYKAENLGRTRHVQAGEEFDLTRFETGVLLSPPEYNGRVTGGQHEMVAAFNFGGTKGVDGAVAKASALAQIPTVSLRAVNGSIKDLQMIPVLKFTAEKTDKGVTRKTREILPGFEKWAPLCIETVRASSGAGASAPKAQRNKSCDAFLQILAKKAAQG